MPPGQPRSTLVVLGHREARGQRQPVTRGHLDAQPGGMIAPTPHAPVVVRGDHLAGRRCVRVPRGKHGVVGDGHGRCATLGHGP